MADAGAGRWRLEGGGRGAVGRRGHNAEGPAPLDPLDRVGPGPRVAGPVRAMPTALRRRNVRDRPSSVNGAPYVASAAPWAKSRARTSSAIRAACSVRAVHGRPRYVDVQRTAIRSATSRPLFLRASWIRRIASRARPARRSSGVISRSRATVAPESDATDQPSRGVSVMMTSSGARVTGSPSTSTEAVPSRRARDSAAASASATALATAWTPLPNRLPSARKLAFAVVSTRRAADLGERGQGGDVQLLRDLGAQLRRERLEARRRDQRAGQRLAGLDARLGARGAAELDQAAHQRHLPGELRVDRATGPPPARSTGAPTPGRPG